MTELVRDKDFRRLMKKDPAKAHEIATKAAFLGRDRVGEVLRAIRERPKAERIPEPPAPQPVKIVAEIVFIPRALDGLERYRGEHGLPYLSTAAMEIVTGWIRRESGIDYLDFESALKGIVVEFLERKKYVKIEGR